MTAKLLSQYSDADLVAYVKELNAKTESEKKAVLQLESEVAKYTPDLYPNGIRDISKLIWPYQMNTGYLDIGAENVKPTNQANIANNNQAAFVINEIIPTIFEVVGPNDYKYIDLSDENADLVEQVFVKFSDSSSDRYFNTDFFHISHLGNPRFLAKMLSNPIVGPSSGFYVELSCTGTKQYKVLISLQGYRLNIQDNDNLLSYTTLD